jgi:hypothetical protein
MQKIIGLVLPLILVIVAWTMPAPTSLHAGSILNDPDSGASGQNDSGQKKIGKPEAQPSPPAIKKWDWLRPSEVKGVYATGWMAGSRKWLPKIVKFIDETEINSLVIDVKDDTGTLSYNSEVPLTKEIGASQPKIANFAQVIKVLQEHQIYPIARIVVFKDPLLAQKKPEWAVKDINGGPWRDRKGLSWVDPHNKLVWDYVIDIAKEAIGKGFQEIQFDYVRFTSDGDLKRCVYPYKNGELRQDVIQAFLQYAKEQLKPYDVPISADIFGLTTSAADDLGIGQQFEKIAQSVDIVCPMVYPSHYAPGSFGLRIPDLHPYDTVYRGISDARKRLIKMSNSTTQLRPWLQDFSLGNPYGRSQVQAQIQAVHDAGIKEWIFWNPSCRYSSNKYN